MKVSDDEWQQSFGGPRKPVVVGPAVAVAADPNLRRRAEEFFEPARPQLTLVPNHDPLVFECDVDDGVLLPEGKVLRIEVRGIEEDTRWIPPRVVLVCIDIDTGERVVSYAEKPVRGKTTLTPRMKFYRWWEFALGHKPTRLDRPPKLHRLIGMRFEAKARTVKHDKDKTPHKYPYSIVELTLVLS